jgi:UDP-N-acetylmuramoyl-tripeptide--D-alanyl-D-alanine ligase
MSIKNKLYFLITSYFQIWAGFVLKRWKPIIIAVVGSAGKTSTMNMIETVLSQKLTVKVSQKTNAASAIPLNILGLKQINFSIGEWLKLILLTPWQIGKIPEQKIYLCEMDTDRTDEMKLHTKLIKPHITCWLSATPAHTQNFTGNDQAEIIENMLADQVQAATKTKNLLIANAQDQNITSAIVNLNIQKAFVSLDKNNPQIINLKYHHIDLTGTTAVFEFDQEKLKNLLKKEVVISEIRIKIPLGIISKINMYGLGVSILLGLSFDIETKEIQKDFADFRLPPGRMSLFAGKNATTIIDSSYNSNKVATIDALSVLKNIGETKTLAILGDMRELGDFAQSEHEELVQAIVSQNIGRVILIGSLMQQFVLPILLKNKFELNQTVFALNPKETKDLVMQKDFLPKGETILIKGSQNTLFLEEIVKSLLVSEKDEQFLCRKEKIWEKERKKVYES